MDNKKYNNFVNSLCNGTRDGKIKWNCLEDSVIISEAIGVNIVLDSFSVDGRSFEYSQSFFTQKGTDVIVFCYSMLTNHCLLVMADKNMKYSKFLTEKEIGREPIKLLAVIRKQFPNPESVMDAFITEFGS